jgi:PAS domain S-box-containing protein
VAAGGTLGPFDTVRRTKDGNEIAVSVTMSTLRDASGAVLGASEVTRKLDAVSLDDQACARLAALVESSDDAIISKTLSGVITSWNRAAEKTFGYATQEAIGENISLIVPPDKMDEERAVLEQIRRGERTEHFETTRVTKDGSIIDVSLTISPIVDERGVLGASTIARDISERKRVDLERGRLAAIVDSSDDAIVGKTLDGIITSWNGAAEKIFGYLADETIGKSITMIIPPERLSEEDFVLSQVRQGNRLHHFETVRVRKDGTRIEVSLTVSPIRDPNGKIIGTSKIARDITNRKLVERERAALLREAQEANHAKDAFLAMLGHELRNPLAAIANAVQLLDAVGSSDAADVRARSVLGRQTQHLSRLVDDLLDVGRVLANKVILQLSMLDVGSAVSSHVETLKISPRGASHHILCDIDSVWATVDPVRLEQIVTNLVDNACKYSPSGTTIQVSVRREGNDAVISVEDQGMGIAAELLPQIFELFVQGPRGLDRSQGGLGIGLTLVKRLTELHGGNVEARSAGNRKGSHFLVRIPAQDAPIAQPKTDGRGHVNGQAARQRMLIVEDHEDAREMLRELLIMRGHEVFEASDGAHGLEEALRILPDVAIVDIGLPEIDGYEVARRIRGDRRGDCIFLVALSGYGSAEDRRRAKEAGFDVALTKPVNLQELTQILRQRATSD